MLPGWTIRVPERSAATGPKDLATPSRRSVGVAFGMSLRRAVRAVGDDRGLAVESFKRLNRNIDRLGQDVKNLRRVRCPSVALAELLSDQG
ncbi:hypothetical protein GCM10017772_13260 [Promicromonospora soli]|uniref:Uncharacterized protein n=1 Tax=Promicromonospora soli TaxID=2035533 RepID=A0A919KQV5_9MICO|nr:hypothetical protein GCM10017772_13260 [Promicromonospora soli]